MKILYYNNCWFTNVGEAFIDLGAMQIIKKLFPTAQIANFSDMSRIYVNKVLNNGINGKLAFGHVKKNVLVYDMLEDLSADVIVMAGMFATREFCECEECKSIMKMIEKGAKLILLGLGGLKYDLEEKRFFGDFLKKTKPLLIMTRDNLTYEIYKNDVENCIKGIDCALWSNEIYNPVGFANSKYDIVSFNRLKEPSVLEERNSSIKIVRPFHFQCEFNKKQLVENVFLSDTPYDYITLYANANQVYTDLVHGTLISLLYETPVKYFYFDQRSKAFDAINDLCINKEGFMSIRTEKLNVQKNDIILQMKRILGLKGE